MMLSRCICRSSSTMGPVHIGTGVFVRSSPGQRCAITSGPQDTDRIGRTFRDVIHPHGNARE